MLKNEKLKKKGKQMKKKNLKKIDLQYQAKQTNFFIPSIYDIEEGLIDDYTPKNQMPPKNRPVFDGTGMKTSPKKPSAINAGGGQVKSIKKSEEVKKMDIDDEGDGFNVSKSTQQPKEGKKQTTSSDSGKRKMAISGAWPTCSQRHCLDCTEMIKFLADGDRDVIEFQVASDRRQHLHIASGKFNVTPQATSNNIHVMAHSEGEGDNRKIVMTKFDTTGGKKPRKAPTPKKGAAAKKQPDPRKGNITTLNPNKAKESAVQEVLNKEKQEIVQKKTVSSKPTKVEIPMEGRKMMTQSLFGQIQDEDQNFVSQSMPRVHPTTTSFTPKRGPVNISIHGNSSIDTTPKAKKPNALVSAASDHMDIDDATTTPSSGAGKLFDKKWTSPSK